MSPALNGVGDFSKYILENLLTIAPPTMIWYHLGGWLNMVALFILLFFIVLYVFVAHMKLNRSKNDKEECKNKNETTKSESLWVKLLTLLLLFIVVVFILFFTGVLQLKVTFFLL